MSGLFDDLRAELLRRKRQRRWWEAVRVTAIVTMALSVVILLIWRNAATISVTIFVLVVGLGVQAWADAVLQGLKQPRAPRRR